MVQLDKPIKITVCADGFVSIMRNSKDRRLKAALPCYSVDDIATALTLIQRVCMLRCCTHGGKTGTLVEPWAPNFPLQGDAETHHIDQLGELFRHEEATLYSVSCRTHNDNEKDLSAVSDQQEGSGSGSTEAVGP